MFYLSNFTNKEGRKKRIARDVSGTALGIQTIRHGLPRALGVRLESHSTSRQKAKGILKDGYLDPSKSGTSAIQALSSDLHPAVATKLKNSKGHVFITGQHPTVTDLNPLQERLKGGSLRRSYRGDSIFTPDQWKRMGEKNFLEVVNPDKFAENFLEGKYKDLYSNSVVGRLPIINHIRGRSLYVGGSTNYFKNNFKPDPDLPFAMMTNQKLKVSGNRLGATIDAIKREGLPSLIKSSPSRVLTGLSALGIGGVTSAKLLSRKTRSDKGKTRGKYKK